MISISKNLSFIIGGATLLTAVWIGSVWVLNGGGGSTPSTPNPTTAISVIPSSSGNQEKNINLVETPRQSNLPGQQANNTQTEPNKLAQVTGTAPATKSQTYTFLIYNNLDAKHNNYVGSVNNYINTLNINGFNEYIFYSLNNAGLNDKNCSVKFNAEQTQNTNLLSSMKKLSFVDTLQTFQKVSNWNKGIKLFIIGDSVDFGCNSVAELDALQKILGTNNSNIFIIGLDKTEGAGKEGTITKEEEYFNEMKIKLGVQYLKAKNAGVLSDFLNTKIYPIQVGTGNMVQNNINTELLFFDDANNPTAATTTVYVKKGTLFNKQGEYTNDGINQLSLLPGTYYFEVKDLNYGMIIKTEPQTINISQKFKQSFYFRKAKTTISVEDNAGMPVSSTIEIFDKTNGNFKVQEAKGVSQFIGELTPGKYDLKVKTKNKYTFTQELIIDGAKSTVDIKFKEEIKKLEVNVKNNDLTPKNDVFVTIMNGDNENVYSKSGGAFSVDLGAGSYVLVATDSTTGAKVEKNIEVSSALPTTSTDIVFRTASVVLDIGSNPMMLRIYDKKTYDAAINNENKESLALRSVSGSGKMKMNLFPGEYAVEIFNIANKNMWTKIFTVWDFDEKEISISDSFSAS